MSDDLTDGYRVGAFTNAVIMTVVAFAALAIEPDILVHHIIDLIVASLLLSMAVAGL
jgi:hypothetical protein